MPRAAQLERVATKVPEITASFWVIKVLTTGVGETASDYLFHQFAPLVAISTGLIGLVSALIAQFRARRYIPWVYWSAAGMVSVFGTMVADVVHVGLGVPYLTLTIVYSLAVAVLFAAWYASERTLSIHTIVTRRRESFYWATVLATFALGTAVGDLTAKTMQLGFLASVGIFAVAIALPAIAHRALGLNAIAAFWLAYIVTRPLGASYADWFAGPTSDGGLGLGTGPVTLVGLVAIVAAVVYVTKRQVGVPEAAN
ncbi:hypothetical protein [Kutzneria buriramensis]|uniref:Putative membrane-anchored protein n=1 Tax=Kutzneria buriramensis TaxID=1045776 RepID=A0A3E0HIM8_9PSEU|nr:hypothetical protein [Kutzneria buriramensis]REH46287.1 putative membrane-anchored protein [Kutzneria buriramensis]